MLPGPMTRVVLPAEARTATSVCSPSTFTMPLLPSGALRRAALVAAPSASGPSRPCRAQRLQVGDEYLCQGFLVQGTMGTDTLLKHQTWCRGRGSCAQHQQAIKHASVLIWHLASIQRQWWQAVQKRSRPHGKTCLSPGDVASRTDGRAHWVATIFQSAGTHLRQKPTSGGHQTSVGRPLTIMASSPSSAVRSSVIAGCLAAR